MPNQTLHIVVYALVCFCVTYKVMCLHSVKSVRLHVAQGRLETEAYAEKHASHTSLVFSALVLGAQDATL